MLEISDDLKSRQESLFRQQENGCTTTLVRQRSKNELQMFESFARHHIIFFLFSVVILSLL